MAVFRIEKTRDYTVMSNHHLKDRTLTLKSKGLLSMMLSLPDEWNYTTRGLAAICREGVDSIGAALKELETHGYIRRTQLRDEKGKITDTEYVIYEMPQCEPPSSPGTSLPGTAKPYTENPDMGIPDTAEPCTENPAQLNTNQTKTDLSSTELSNPIPSNPPTPAGARMGTDRMGARECYREVILDNIEYGYLKGKNAKKYRHGIEYGSARWGTAADIAPYMDKNFFQNIPMTQTERITMASRPKQPKYARNKNILVIGGSGSGKTRFFCKPSLLQAHSSYVCTDPKGTLLPEIGAFLERKKYRIKCLNLINFRKSMKYNPLAYIRSEKDILKLVNALIMNTKGEGEKSSEDFWVKAERLYYSALIGYIWYEATEEEKNFITLLDLINASEAREDDETYEQLMGADKIEPQEKSIIDRSVGNIYREYLKNYQGEPPTLKNLYDDLMKQVNPEAHRIALALELFTVGSLNVFSHQTNINTKSRILCFDIQDLGENLKSVGLLVMLDAIYNRVIQNRREGKYTHVYIDEIYLFFANGSGSGHSITNYSSEFLYKCWKRFRKYGATLTGITQNVEECLLSNTARMMFANSEFLLMLNQATTDREQLARLLGASDTQMSYVDNAPAGHGLIKVGGAIVPFANELPKNTELYRLMSTRPGED